VVLLGERPPITLQAHTDVIILSLSTNLTPDLYQNVSRASAPAANSLCKELALAVPVHADVVLEVLLAAQCKGGQPLEKGAITQYWILN